MDRSKRMTGLAIAGAAAALFVTSAPVMSADTGTVKVKCYGANACKGKAECKTSMSACKGHNECKGKGFVMMEEKACVEKLGRS